MRFTSTTIVPDAVKGDTVKWTHTITAIDAKSGIKETVEGEGYPPEKPQRGSAAPAGTWAAGAAAFAAIMLGGLWLANRARRKS